MCYLIISARQQDKVNLSDILRALKKYTSSQIIRKIETTNEILSALYANLEIGFPDMRRALR